MEKPLVSICSLTFNHADYIRRCLDGFLMQKCNFKFEVLIHDDASTDGTSDIIMEYQAKYPDIIKPIIQTENQWSKGIKGHNFRHNLPRAEGKYIAICEGDDYWIDPQKLQKQVDFLEKNPEYSLVCGGFKSVNTITGEEQIVIKNVENCKDSSQKGFDITLPLFFNQWLTKNLTLVYRKELYNPDDFKNYKFTRDVHFNYHLLKKGKGYYMRAILGAYHVHEGGFFSLGTKDNKLKTAYLITKELYKNNKEDDNARVANFNTLRSIISNKVYARDKSLKKKNLILELLNLIRNKKEIKKTIKTIFDRV
ncbi:glycosyltransferase involved in cell wall biosynthesis [Flavobacterium arsenatis]|uniref:Glycosyltransferase involved in cell wall biosynthesis n=1 Tax=Flavobacterium arsenatis TaxID=1484332 RepID=A0ABU1TLZ9_9FLAO|nr:glycosyltransferase [Flavobacterium arsenatis]MDR6966991.1 glycosyltransferase involved in cell wall biosynthesis [Flavobacterium arsenatis]